MSRFVAALLILALVGPPAPAGAQESTDEAVYHRFDEISALRANGEFDQAIGILQQIVQEYSNSDEVLRRAYNDLVFTVLSKRSVAADEESRAALDAEARARAEEAIRRFPDLQADRHFFPPELNRIYDELRLAMYGELNVTTSPSPCWVRIGDTYQGTSPLHVPYFPVGPYRLTITQTGYKDRIDSLFVVPGGVLQREVSLSRERDRKWWLARVIPAVAVGVGVLLLTSLSSDDQPPAEEPLPGAPEPPTR